MDERAKRAVSSNLGMKIIRLCGCDSDQTLISISTKFGTNKFELTISVELFNGKNFPTRSKMAAISNNLITIYLEWIDIYEI